jgi:cell division septum initiation protein DivIVA
MAYEQLIDKKTRPLKEENENLKKQMTGHKQQMAQAQQAQQQGQGGALNIGALFGGGQ